MMFILFCLASFLLAAAASAVGTKLLIPLLRKDIPNARSSHNVPTPRGGGLALVIVIAAALLLLVALSSINYLAVLLGFCGLAALSWIDDKKPLSPALRLGCHIAAVSAVVFLWPEGQRLLPETLPLLLERSLIVLAWVWFINLTNFMDGIDGLSAMQSISLCVGFLALSALAITAYDHQFLVCIIAGAAAGFLFYNWHPAKVFLGDVGSIPLGFILGWLLLQLAFSVSIIPAVILPLYYLADSGITLVKRLRRGEKIWQAHRSHFYQIAATQAENHAAVVCLIAWFNFGLIGLAAASVAWSPWLGLGAIAWTAWLLWRLKHIKKQA